MKRRVGFPSFVALIVLVVFATVATGDLLNPPPAVEEKPLRRPKQQGPKSSQLDLVIDRVWAEGDRNFARVRLSNTSGHDLDGLVVHCSEFDFSGEQLAAYDAVVAGGKNGSLPAGVARTFQLDLRARGSRLHAITCMSDASLR